MYTNDDRWVQIRKERSELDYRIRIVRGIKLINEFIEGYIFIKNNPSNYWDNSKQSQYIESIILGTGVFDTPIIINDKEGYPPYPVIDGRKRLISLKRLYKDELTIEGLAILTTLNGCKWSDLHLPIHRKVMEHHFNIVNLRSGFHLFTFIDN